MLSLPETTLKSLLSSLNGVIPESDRVSPSYTVDAFGSFVVDFLHFILLLFDLQKITNNIEQKTNKLKNAYLPLDHVMLKGGLYLSPAKVHIPIFQKLVFYLFVM